MTQNSQLIHKNDRDGRIRILKLTQVDAETRQTNNF